MAPSLNSYADVDRVALAVLCRRNHVSSLALFGSILRADFGPDSDVDVLVDFEPGAEISLFDVSRMSIELEALFHRRVDLVETRSLENPLRRTEILRTRQVVYGS